MREVKLTSSSYASAYRKGYAAALGGYTQKDCPYDDHRTRRGSMTFSRAFMRYWQDGFTHAKEGLPLKYYAKPRGLDNAMFQARITVYRVSSAFVDKEGKLFLKFGSEYESVDSIIKEYGKK